MKSKSLTIVLVLLLGLQTNAQFKLSGQIKNYTGKELKINIPVVFGFYRENSILIPVEKDGTFALSVPIQAVKFGTLIYQRKFYSLLPHPNKTLRVSIAEKDSTLVLLAGTSLPENTVMQAINLGENPFFMANEGKEYANLFFLVLKNKVVSPYYAQRDKAEYYPQYFIFDKEGKLVVTKAQRPSNEAALYAQLNQYLR